MARRKHHSAGKVQLSSKAGLARAQFVEAEHKRSLDGKFADQAGKGDDAPKKGRRPAAQKPAGKVSGSHTIEIIVKGNPKKGTAGKRFALYKSGMTVDDYIKAVGDKKQALRDIAWDMKQGWIKASAPGTKSGAGLAQPKSADPKPMPFKSVEEIDAENTAAKKAAEPKPELKTKSKVPLASGTPVDKSSNPDPLPLGAKLSADHKLHLEVKGNPKKSTAAERFAKYKDGMTIQEYIDAVGDKKQALKDIAWDMKQGWVSASAPTGKTAGTATVASPAPAAAAVPAAAAAAKAPAPPPAPAPAPTTAPAATAPSTGKAAPPAGTSVATKGDITIVKAKNGYEFDALDGGGAAALDPNTHLGNKIGVQTKSAKLSDNDYIKVSSTVYEKIKQLESQGKNDFDPEVAALKRAQKILLTEEFSDPAAKTDIFGFVTNEHGQLKGAIAGKTSPNSKVVTITGHAGLGGGGGTAALEALVSKAKLEGKEQILVKSGLTAYYKSQGFKASTDEDGYLTLEVKAYTFTPAPAAASIAYASLGSTHLSTPSETMLSQIKKGQIKLSSTHVEPLAFAKYEPGSSSYKQYEKATMDSPLSAAEYNAARTYTGGFYHDLNKRLRNGDELTGEQKTVSLGIDAAMKRATFKEDHVLYRGVPDEAFKNLLSMLTEGDVLVNPAYTSTSVKNSSFGAGTSYAASMRIYARKGATGLPVNYLSKHPTEYETILPRSAPLRFMAQSSDGYFEFEYV